MGVIGNTIGEVRYVDLPLTAGTNPTVSWNADRVLDLIGVEVLAAGASAAALKVDGATKAGGAIASFTKNVGQVHAASPTRGVPLASAGGGAQQANSTTVGNVNWQSSGTVQGGISDRNGSVPEPGALTPLVAAVPAPAASALSAALTTGAPITALPVTALPSAANSGASVVVTSGANTQTFVLSAAAAKGATSLTVTSATPNFAYPSGSAVAVAGAKVEVDVTGTVTVLTSLPAADGNGFITLPVGTTQDAANYVAGPDNLPFRVKASDTTLDTFAGFVRLVFQVPVSDPNTTAENAGSYPKNGIQKGSTY